MRTTPLILGGLGSAAVVVLFMVALGGLVLVLTFAAFAVTLLSLPLPAGETIRQSMTFRVPPDARELFLTAKYRPFTFQILLPGDLSLVPRGNAQMIRIQ